MANRAPDAIFLDTDMLIKLYRFGLNSPYGILNADGASLRVSAGVLYELREAANEPGIARQVMTWIGEQEATGRLVADRANVPSPGSITSGQGFGERSTVEYLEQLKAQQQSDWRPIILTDNRVDVTNPSRGSELLGRSDVRLVAEYRAELIDRGVLTATQGLPNSAPALEVPGQQSEFSQARPGAPGAWRVYVAAALPTAGLGAFFFLFDAGMHEAQAKAYEEAGDQNAADAARASYWPGFFAGGLGSVIGAFIGAPFGPIGMAVGATIVGGAYEYGAEEAVYAAHGIRRTPPPVQLPVTFFGADEVRADLQNMGYHPDQIEAHLRNVQAIYDSRRVANSQVRDDALMRAWQEFVDIKTENATALATPGVLLVGPNGETGNSVLNADGTRSFILNDFAGNPAITISPFQMPSTLTGGTGWIRADIAAIGSGPSASAIIGASGIIIGSTHGAPTSAADNSPSGDTNFVVVPGGTLPGGGSSPAAILSWNGTPIDFGGMQNAQFSDSASLPLPTSLAGGRLIGWYDQQNNVPLLEVLVAPATESSPVTSILATHYGRPVDDLTGPIRVTEALKQLNQDTESEIAERTAVRQWALGPENARQDEKVVENSVTTRAGVTVSVSPSASDGTAEWGATVKDLNIKLSKVTEESLAEYGFSTPGPKLNSAIIAQGASEIGSILGSQIGAALAGSNPFARVAAGTVLSATLATVGRGLGSYLSDTSGELSLSEAFANAADTFGSNLSGAFQSQAIGAVSGFLTGELADSLGLDGFGGGLLRAANDNTPADVECARAA